MTVIEGDIIPQEDFEAAEAAPEAADAKDDSFKKAVIRYDEYWDFRTYSYKLRKTAKPDKKLRHRPALLVVRRVIDEKGRHVDTEIDIKSSIIKDVLIQLNEGVENLKLMRTPPSAHPSLFYHSLNDLEARVKEEELGPGDETVLAHLRHCIRFAREEQAETIDSMNTLLAAEQITWQLLWALFKPNSLVYHYHRLTEQHQILLVRSTRQLKNPETGRMEVQVACGTISDNGDAFGYAKSYFQIEQYEGAMRIQDLQVFPLDRHPECVDIRQAAIRRAQRYVKMTGHKYQEVTGAGMRQITSTSTHKPRFIKFLSFGRLIVDAKSFRVFEPDAEYNRPIYRKLGRDNLSEDQLAICSPLVLGFCFGVKLWGAFAIDRCSDVVWGDEAYPSLVLEKPKKNILYSLVKQHHSKKDTFDDVIQGKGKGLVGLLSGGPGLGKTLTAEAISELTRQPLYTVSAGELGTVPKEVDERLSMILELAVTWDAILLLDEADVFLQARSDVDITRNALVSIFLRQLEYFQGILILTTNRITNCDPAFESRIHFSFHYPELSQASRAVIWKTFWRKASIAALVQDDNSQEPLALSEDQAMTLAAHDLNGRQIKNTVGNALSIALGGKEPLKVSHVETVLGVIQSWSEAAVSSQDLKVTK